MSSAAGLPRSTRSVPGMPAEVQPGPRLAITGGFGFLGWHTACRLRALHGITPVRLGREDLADPDRLRHRLADVDGIIHIAGVNRAQSDDEVERGNVRAAEALAAALSTMPKPLPIAYANSIQADGHTPYGRGKAAAGRILAAVTDGNLADVRLPNLFGEHGLPQYNSFVATFAYEIANGRQPTVINDKQVPLLHAQAAAAELIDAVVSNRSGEIRPAGEPHGVSEVRDRLLEIANAYGTGEIPRLATEFDIDLFNTYRSYRFPDGYPIATEVHHDARGALFEAVRSHGSTSQVFASTTAPGQGRGEHYHLRKIERFVIIKGQAEINLRRLLHDHVITYRLSEDRPAFVDMPTLWVHNLRNIGDEELIMLFWSDQLLDPNHPDQYPEKVTLERLGVGA